MVKLTSFGKCVALEDVRQFELFSSVVAAEHPLCDVILRLPGSEADAWVSIGSNSALLRMKSSVLDAMWQLDSSAKGVETIDIVDCSEEAIRALNAVAFGQLDAVEITTENVADLLYAATKYDFKLVEDSCHQFIDDALAKYDANEWLPVVSALCKGKQADFAQKTIQRTELFGSNANAVFECDAITTLPFALLRDLLKCDALTLSEEVIWLQCVKWAKHNDAFQGECDGHEETEDVKMDDNHIAEDFVSLLIPLKEYIRFPLMKLKFFYKNVVSTGLLTKDEVVSVGFVALEMPADSELFCSALPRSGPPPSFDLFDTEHFEVRKKGATQVLLVTGDRRALFGCSKGWRTGVHKWRFTVDKFEDQRFGFGVSQNCEEYQSPPLTLSGIGKVTNTAHKTYCFRGNGWRVLFYGGEYKKSYRDWVRYNVGDTVELILDCGNWSLTAIHNGSTTKIVSLERDHVYFPVVSSFNPKSEGLMPVWTNFGYLDFRFLRAKINHR